jgi:NADPH:quinone reductase-like Zn-dependent oxidoreductase
MTTTIRKVLIAEFGDESKVTVVHDELPAPAEKEVQVRIMYAGFSGTDINMRRGIYPMQKKAPLTTGSCLVGTVVQNGPSSTRFKEGDLICCLSIYDAEATYANLPEKYLVLVPAGMDPKIAPPLLMDWNTGRLFTVPTSSQAGRLTSRT